MVFGFGEGSIDVKLEKLSFSAGETILGKVFLKVDKPKKARGVRVEFFGERTVGHGKNRRTERVYSFSLNLSGEREYLGAFEYPFEIKIPSDVGSKQLSNDLLGTAANLASVFGGVSPTRWFVSASLDVPMGMDISKKIQISVG